MELKECFTRIKMLYPVLPNKLWDLQTEWGKIQISSSVSYLPTTLNNSKRVLSWHIIKSCKLTGLCAECDSMITSQIQIASPFQALKTFLATYKPRKLVIIYASRWRLVILHTLFIAKELIHLQRVNWTICNSGEQQKANIPKDLPHP